MNIFKTEPETLDRRELVGLVHDLRGRLESLVTATQENFAQDAVSVFHLSPAEGRILSALISRDRLTHEQTQSASCSNDLRDPPGLGTIKTHITRIRHKIEPTEAHIINIWSFGYQITPSDKEKIKAWVSTHKGGGRV